MHSAWIVYAAFIVCIERSVNCGVVVRKRPISLQERFSITTSTPSPVTVSNTIKPEVTTSSRRLSRLTLPSNATSIRSDITDSFSCNERTYGYYADVENDCQIFHVCLPVTYADGKEQKFRWSFICPDETTFNQEAFTCMRTDEMPFDCADSEKFYDLNRFLGLKDELSSSDVDSNELNAVSVTGAEHIRNGAGEKPKAEVTETIQKDKLVNVPVIKAPVRNRPQVPLHRAPISRRSTTSPPTTTTTQYSTSAETTEKYIPTTIYQPEASIGLDNGKLSETTSSDGVDKIETTTYLSIDSSEAATEQSTDAFSTTQRNIAEITTILNNQNEFGRDQTTISAPTVGITRIIPELIESGKSTERVTERAKTTDEVVESIKLLQNIFPSQNLQLNGKLSLAPTDDLRSKRFLFKADSVRNRQKLFAKLNSRPEI